MGGVMFGELGLQAGGEALDEQSDGIAKAAFWLHVCMV